MFLRKEELKEEIPGGAEAIPDLVKTFVQSEVVRLLVKPSVSLSFNLNLSLDECTIALSDVLMF